MNRVTFFTETYAVLVYVFFALLISPPIQLFHFLLVVEIHIALKTFENIFLSHSPRFSVTHTCLLFLVCRFIIMYMYDVYSLLAE